MLRWDSAEGSVGLFKRGEGRAIQHCESEIGMGTALTKRFATLGVVDYKIATTAQEMEDALSLVFKEYAKRGLISPARYQSPIRVGVNHILREETKIFVGVKNGEVIITLSAFKDSPLGLPMDGGYGAEADALRAQGRKIGEVGYFAVKSGMFKRKRLFGLDFEKLDFIFTMFRMAIQWGLYFTDLDDGCLVTNPNPKRMSFKYFPLDVMGAIKHYGFDEMHVKPKPAIAKRVNLKALRPVLKNPLSWLNFRNALFRLAVGARIPPDVLGQEMRLSRRDLGTFFVEKSDILKNLQGEKLDYVLKTCGLSRDDYDLLLSGRS